MIVLLTDFGQSEYVGVMKGVIYSIDSDAKIIDLCHDISPQSIIEASWILKNNYTFFLKGTIFCCVVDPGVGSERKALAVKTDNYYFVAPDNGLLWETLKEQRIVDIRKIHIPEDVSRTFHGRDVFAKAAANISKSSFDALGTKIMKVEKLELYKKGTEGIVVRIDRFGNVITNLHKQGDRNEYFVRINGKEYTLEYCPTYSIAKENGLFLIEGSSKTFEVSLKNGSANEKMHVRVGDKIRIS